MKYNTIRALICITVTASVLTGCGVKNTPTPSDNITNEAVIEEVNTIDEQTNENESDEKIEVEEETAAMGESIETEAETPAPIIEKELLLSIISSGEGNTYKACDEQGVEYDLSLADTFPEEEKSLLSIGSINVIKLELKEESSVSAIVTSAKVAEAGSAYEALEKVSFEKIHGFSVDNTVTGTRYAKQAVNVRSGPSTDYEKIGGLAFAQEVNVTGEADSGWYQIHIDDQVGYVSNKYLVTEKPVAQAAPPPQQTTASTQTSGGTDFYAVYSEAQMNEALAKGDLVTYFNMLNANSAATMGGESSSGGGEEISGPTLATQKSTSLSTDFVNYMNQKRVEAGLSELSWSDSMGNTALERAEEITSDFSHSGVRNCNAENIAQMNTPDVGSWYDAFYNSSTHQLNMMDATYKSAAAAVCQTGNSYYVVVLFGF